ncbi:MAG: amidase [Acidimicrobiales bacterium]|nr:amidase [Acidimicrobiales bacterium]RZV41998.1 MAG: amidase [Acidimicrobiales bacterium]
MDSPVDIDLCYLSATEQLRLFRAGELSPVEVLEAQFDRMAAVEPVINAFTDTYKDEAMQAARSAEAVYTNRPEDARPLEGLTVTIKDEMDVKGQRNTEGSLIYKDRIATADHPVAERLREAGAIFHARSATPEFCSAWVTTSRLHGTTRNPWNTALTPSGSSGGSGAALAAGMTTLATGSDIGGSIRGPAAACGVVGFKPPYGRNPDVSPFNLDPYCHVGPLTRTTSDTALMQNVMSGIHPLDIATLRDEMVIPTSFEGLEGKRIAWSLDVGNAVVSDEVAAQTEKVIDALAASGAIVEQVDLGWGPEVGEACRDYLDHLMGASLIRYVEQYPDLVCDYNIFYAERAKASTADQFFSTFEMAGRVYEQFGPMMEQYYAFVCPTLATLEMKAEQKPWDRMMVQSRDIDSDYDACMMPVFNMLSRLPVLAVPAGLTESRVPAGVQIVARAYDDPRVFHVASALEEAMPWLDCTQRRPKLALGPRSNNL